MKKKISVSSAIKISFSAVILLLALLCRHLAVSAQKNISAASSVNSGKIYPALVSKVTDGDTVEIFFLDEIPENCNIEEKARMIGIDTPEMNFHKKTGPEYFAEEAKEFTETELLNENVNIQLDSRTGLRDKYGRLLCYIYKDNFLFNEVLAEKGYGKYYDSFEFEKTKMDYIKNAEKYAREKKYGIWQ